MDSDQLHLIGAVITRAVLSQDVTEYAARMAPSVVLNVNYDKEGNHRGAPDVPVRTMAGLVSAIQSAKDGNGPLYPPLLPVKEVPALPVAGANAAALPALTLPSLTKSPQSAVLSPAVTDAFTPAQRVANTTEVARHTLDIFLWMGKGKFIAEPKVYTSVRKPKKDTSLLVAKAASRGPSVPSPPRTASRDREFLSVVVVSYGRPGFLVQDECYVADDGYICIIDRFLHAPADPQDAAFAKAKISFFGIGKGKLDLVNNKPPPLDFSFKGLAEPLDILRVAPTSGKVHVPKPVYKAPEEKRPLDRLQYAVSDKSKETTRKLVVAKNRNGEEEAYEFEVKPVLKAEAEESRNADDEELRGLVRRLENRYECDAIRLCNNNLHTAQGLVKGIHNLVTNYLLTVQWLDLSNNRLTDLPDLSMLPLRTLHLHANNISDWTVVEASIAPLHTLTSVTLFGNPIATTSTEYRDAALMRLLVPRPKGSPVLKALDFAPISSTDAHTAEMYSRFTKGGTVPLSSTRGRKDATVSPRSARSTPRLAPASPRRQ